MSSPRTFKLTNANVVDVNSGTVLGERTIEVDDSRIVEIAESAGNPNLSAIDAKGGFLIPGLIDCHCHVVQTTSDLAGQTVQSPQYVMAKAYGIMKGMLQRGFTSVRDCGGADFGIVRAVEEGIAEGPRIFHCGKALTQTGGHGDFRAAGSFHDDQSYWAPRISRIADGVNEVRKLARDEIRKNASFIKIMGGGGVASPTDRIDSDQYSIEEIKAVVEEASMANIYVAAHAYCSRTVIRAVGNGVRTVEHCTQMSDDALEVIRDNNAFMVPTLIILRAFAEEGVADGLPPELVGKIGSNVETGLNAIERAQRLGVKMAYGSDLLGNMHKRQLEEFVLRSEVVSSAELLRSATLVGAELVNRADSLGQIREGFIADMLVLDSNPLDDIQTLAQPDRNLKTIFKAGAVVMNRLG